MCLCTCIYIYICMFIVTYFWCKRDLVLGSDKTVASSHLNPFMIHFSPWQYASFRDEAQKLSFEKVFSSIYCVGWYVSLFSNILDFPFPILYKLSWRRLHYPPGKACAPLPPNPRDCRGTRVAQTSQCDYLLTSGPKQNNQCQQIVFSEKPFKSKSLLLNCQGHNVCTSISFQQGAEYMWMHIQLFTVECSLLCILSIPLLRLQHSATPAAFPLLA